MAPSQNNYTAAQIATALGIKRQAAQWHLRAVPSSVVVVVNGNRTCAWSFSALPEDMRARLETRAEQCGFRNAETMLNKPEAIWQPPIPISELHEDCVDSAVKLQRALALALGRMDDEGLSAGEKTELGLKEYARAFGHRVTERHWRDLMDRTVRRAGGTQNWVRLEIYLPDRLKRKSAVPGALGKCDDELRGLFDVIAGFRNASQPSSIEHALIYLRSFELLESLVATGKNEKKLRRRMVAFLFKHVPSLAASQDAVRVNFFRKLNKWRANGCNAECLADGREEKRGLPRAKPFDSESADKIIYHTVANCGGRVSQGVRELVDADALDPEIAKYFLVQRANKSSIPARLREAVRHEVSALAPFHQGPRAVDKLLPSLDLNYEGIYSMRAVQADDFTMPVYFHVPDGQGWFALTRGQLLLAIDWRSLRILGFCLHPESQYNSGLIRTLFTRVFDEHGLPEILYLERGIWKSSKLITGGAQAARVAKDGLPFSEAEVEMGLRRFGIKFIHARRARSKPVERVGGLLQDLMEGEPFYCGRNERVDCPEVTVRNMRLIAARKAHPADLGCFSLDQWEARLSELCNRYNATVQDGKRLAGYSPDEAFGRWWNHDDPPTKFSAEHRYLLAVHKILVRVGNDATIKFKVRGESFKYFSAETGQRIGRELYAWFNPEAPEVCTFTDANMKNAFTVARHNPVNGLVPDATFEIETAAAHAAVAPNKARYQILKSKFKTSFRATIATPQTETLGRHIATETKAVEVREHARQARVNTIRKTARKLNIPSAIVGDDEQSLEGLNLMEEAMREHARNSETPAVENKS